jgi:ferredoxin
MRICPTNVIQPTGLASGVEGLWTPSLNFRMGSSGCQQSCIACGNLCPTAAIRPISLDERLGKGTFKSQGPIRIGTAFVDRGRCLPWAMDRPCIVCQENCPVSPKAIATRETFEPIQQQGPLYLEHMKGNDLIIKGPDLLSRRFSSGDYFVSLENRPEDPPARIISAVGNTLTLAANPFLKAEDTNSTLRLSIRLQLPFVDPNRCIGCGVCEHECPVKGRRAIRVTAENETRERKHQLVL